MEASDLTTATTSAPEPSETIVLFGNSDPMVQIRQDDGSHVAHPISALDDESLKRLRQPRIQQSVTRLEMWNGFDDQQFVNLTTSTENDRMLSMIYRQLPDEHKLYVVGCAEAEQLWPTHSAKSKPDWVWSNNLNFAKALGAHFGIAVLNEEPKMLLTTVGRDALHAQHLSTAAQPATFNYIGLTASTTTPAASDTALTGEITTSGGGLIRAQGTYAHTAGTNTSTITKTFTANGSDTLPVTVAQIGVFNASTSGTLGYHTALNSSATLSAVGDNVTVTETITGG